MKARANRSFVGSPIFLYSLNRTIGVSKMTDEILTLKEVAKYLKLADKTAYRLAAEGKLPGFKVGGSWRFRKTDIQTWINLQKTSKKARAG